MKVIISEKHIKDGHGMYGDFLENTYTTYLERFGIILVPISNATKNIHAFVDEICPHGIILSGGNDINPSFYKEAQLYNGDYSLDRDALERELLSHAVKKRLPVLGICRGMQFINVFFGGAIIQSIENQMRESKNHVASQHDVRIIDDRASKFFAKGRVSVNSYHKQAVTTKTLSSTLKPFAISEPDGVVEGLYHPESPIAGVQWHPERDGGDKDANERIIGAFINRKLFWL